eukprot:1853215-Rhodomonas_salina.1
MLVTVLQHTLEDSLPTVLVVSAVSSFIKHFFREMDAWLVLPNEEEPLDLAFAVTKALAVGFAAQCRKEGKSYDGEATLGISSCLQICVRRICS